MTNRIEGATLDQERALYHLQNAEVDSCTFSGPADGESALKECRNIVVKTVCLTCVTRSGICREEKCMNAV